LVLNKLDLPERYYRDTWLERAQGGVVAAVPAAVAEPTTAPGTGATPASRYASVVEVSALTGKNVELVIAAIFRHLPVGPAQYPQGQVTNVTNEFWIGEL